jgi:hypothetical protein
LVSDVVRDKNVGFESRWADENRGNNRTDIAKASAPTIGTTRCMRQPMTDESTRRPKRVALKTRRP